MIWGEYWVIIVFVALITDILIGELPGKHPVEYMGDFINWYQTKYYKSSIIRGSILFISLVCIVLLSSFILQYGLFYIIQIYKIPVLVAGILVGIIASSGLASKTLKIYVKNVLNADEKDRAALLSLLVTRNTSKMDEKKIFGSLIESHSENLSDGYIAPLFYLIIFGLPGIMVYKAVSTMDSMLGYKNEKYIYFGKVPAIVDDILNYIPARLTSLLIWIYKPHKIDVLKMIKDAKAYSSSPNAGYPISTAAYYLGIELGGPVYYGENLINKAKVGKKVTENYIQASYDFIKLHKRIEMLILLLMFLTLLFTIFTNKVS